MRMSEANGSCMLTATAFKGFSDTHTHYAVYYAARFGVIQTRKTLHVLLRTFTQTTFSVVFVHGNGDMHACLTE